MDFLATSKFVDVVIDDFEQNMQISVDLFSNIEVRSAITKTFLFSQSAYSHTLNVEAITKETSCAIRFGFG